MHVGRSWSLVPLLLAGLLSAPAAAVPQARAAAAAPAGPTWSGGARTAGDGWAQDGYGATGSGFNPSETRLIPARLGRLTPEWTVAATGTEVCARQSAPVTAGGRLFLTGRESLTAHDIKTGKTLWTFAYADPMDTVTPELAVAGSTLLAATRGCQSQSDADGDLYALDAATGAVRWQAHTDAPDLTLTVDRGVVVVAGQDAAYRGTTAFSLATGKRLWEKALATPAAGVSAAGTLLLTVANRNLTPLSAEAVDITTGATRWRTTGTWSVLAADPAGRFFLAGDPAGALLKVDAATGAIAWTHAGLPGPVAVDTARVYVAGPKTVTAVDLSTGRTTWQRTGYGELLRPVTAAGVLYALTKSIRVDALATATGHSLELAVTAKPADHATVADGRLYLTDGSRLTAYTAPDGY